MKIIGKIEIESNDVELNEGTSAKGKPYRIRTQAGFCSLPNGEYRKIKISLPSNQGAYPVGLYECAISVVVGDFGRLEVGREWSLVPVKKVA